MDVFNTRIAGIPCKCKVLSYSPTREMVITGSGFGDADPPEPSELDYRILDRRGNIAPWLERKVTAADEALLLKQYEEFLNAMA